MSNLTNNTTDLQAILDEVSSYKEILDEQDSIIAQIAAALEGKSAGSSTPTYETCAITFNIDDSSQYGVFISYVKLNADNTICIWAIKTTDATSAVTINAVKGYDIIIGVGGDGYIVDSTEPSDSGVTSVNPTFRPIYDGRCYHVSETAGNTATISLVTD